MEDLSACPVCGGTELELVYRWNNFQSTPTTRSEFSRDLQRSDYTLCDACGVIFARHRQIQADVDRYYHLFPLLGKKLRWFQNYPPLAEYLAEHAKEAQFVLDTLARNRVDLVPDMRVLVLRSDSGVLLARLRDEFGIRNVFGLDYFDYNLRYTREHYGIDRVAKLSSGDLKIPFDGPFDLVISNHQLMHVFKPATFLTTLRKSLAPGGSVLFLNEDDHDFIFARRPMPYHWGVVNNFHKQLFTRTSLLNALRLSGFSGTVQKATPSTLFVQARLAPAVGRDGLIRGACRDTAAAMRRTGRRFLWIRIRSRIAGLTGARLVKQMLRERISPGS